MLSRISHEIQDHKRDVPLLRGRIHLLSLCFYPPVIRSLKKNVPRELRYSLVIFIATHLFNLITTTLLHNNQRYKYRSAYKRIDIARVFGSLVFDFCSFQKEYRSIYVMLVNLPDVLLIYKLIARREYLSFLLSASCLMCFFVGGIVYCQEGPTAIDGIMGHHEIFHLLTVMGFGLVVGANGVVIK
ncbi:hypothetical protein MACK_002598 [Theileria orientalis]|uniref:Uncharacterized protein n=1 Tax=Theileria orientalis TaxID=68886 RepID=A0A976MDJ6_THEOR|nr:hypothetical protein MACK_002598 [Theileria orientalis]